ncbi:MAG: zf-TFIIB domain-containing protein [Pseudomonadota bacterium]|nr:zf-TFIIB domain-containing protein [Pseudomonadota bacterium]
MQCPICATITLQPELLSADTYQSYRCHQCEGHLLKATDYYAWLQQQPRIQPEQAYAGEPIQLEDTQQAKICPSCDRLMRRYAVGRGTDMHLDCCASCDSVWFDRGEWAALKGRNLHDEVYKVFTPHWQNNVRREQAKQRATERYQQRFGEDFTKLNEVHQWLYAHPKKAELLAFLNQADPFRAI